MHRYLRGWHEQGKGKQFQAKIVNFADDFVILSRGRAQEALAWTRWAMGKLKLSLNETKTCIRHARRESFDFLGYTFGPERHRRDGHWYLSAKASKKSIQRFKGHIRAVLRPGNQEPWPKVAEVLNRKIRGWSNYFSYGTRYMAYRAMDTYVRVSVQNFLQRRHKVPGRGTRRFSDEKIFGELGIIRLRWQHIGRPSRA